MSWLLWKQESPAVADKPARRLRKVCTVYVRAVGLYAVARLPIDIVSMVSITSYIVTVSVKCVALEILTF